MPATDQARDSFGEFVAAALPGLLRFDHVLTGDPRKAEDLVQQDLTALSQLQANFNSLLHRAEIVLQAPELPGP